MNVETQPLCMNKASTAIAGVPESSLKKRFKAVVRNELMLFVRAAPVSTMDPAG